MLPERGREKERETERQRDSETERGSEGVRERELKLNTKAFRGCRWVAIGVGPPD